MNPFADKAKLLGNSAARDARRAQLHEPHVAPLTAFLEILRAEAGPDKEIPDFDP